MPTYEEIFNGELNHLTNAIKVKAGSSGAKSIFDLADIVEGIPEQKEEVAMTVDLNLSSGNQVVTPSVEDTVFNSVTIRKPATLISENIAKGITIAGITGTYDNSILTEDRTVELNLGYGNQYITPSSGYGALTSVTVQKPNTLIPENIANGVNIAGVIGSLSGATIPERAGWYYCNGTYIDDANYTYFTRDDSPVEEPHGVYFVNAGSYYEASPYLFEDLPNEGQPINFNFNNNTYTVKYGDDSGGGGGGEDVPAIEGWYYCDGSQFDFSNNTRFRRDGDIVVHPTGAYLINAGSVDNSSLFLFEELPEQGSTQFDYDGNTYTIMSGEGGGSPEGYQGRGLYYISEGGSGEIGKLNYLNELPDIGETNYFQLDGRVYEIYCHQNS